MLLNSIDKLKADKAGNKNHPYKKVQGVWQISVDQQLC
jgi:hypothetical protein